MSVYYSKYGLNTYKGTPYFEAHIPEDYPLNLILQKCRAFRRLPPRLRELSGLAKRWVRRSRKPPIWGWDIDEWYDEEGYELKPGIGERLTDEEIDAQWGRPGKELEELEVRDIPVPAGGFADPDTWEPPPPPPEEPEEYEGPDKSRLLLEIRFRGREYVAKYYGVPVVPDAGALADAILAKVNPRGAG